MGVFRQGRWPSLRTHALPAVCCWKGTVSITDVQCQHEEEILNHSASTRRSKSNGNHEGRKGCSQCTPSSNHECSLAAKEAKHKLLFDAKWMCKIYFVPFQELLDAMKPSSEKPAEGVCAVPLIFSLEHLQDCRACQFRHLLAWFQGYESPCGCAPGRDGSGNV